MVVNAHAVSQCTAPIWRSAMAEAVKSIDPGTERRYLRPMDVVQQTGLSKSTVMAALWSGHLEAYRMGRAWLIPSAAVDRWIRGGGEDAAA
jgi:excisionase family DNA binding protein